MLKREKISKKKCPVRPNLMERPLLDGKLVEELEIFFKQLGNRNRLRILHALIKSGELCVGEIAKAINMQSQAVSNQLRHMSDRNVVSSRREGNNIYYRVIDNCIITILYSGLCQLDCVEERNEDKDLPDKCADKCCIKK